MVKGRSSWHSAMSGKGYTIQTTPRHSTVQEIGLQIEPAETGEVV